MNQAISPYIVTRLYSPILLRPDQMDEKLYNNLKLNLVNVYKGYCYKEYGYIVDIIKILEKEPGRCETEDLSGCARFNVTYACVLCRPLKDKYLVCKIETMTKALVLARNGPIVVIIIPDKINDKNFVTINNGIRYKETPASNKLVNMLKDDIVKVKILSISLKDKADNINVIGYLDDMASKSEMKLFYDDQYDKFEQPGKFFNSQIANIEDLTKNNDIA